MQKNGANSRDREKRIGIRMALVAGTYMMLVFITPLTLEPGTVPELSGRANLIDYATVDGWGSWGNNDHGENSELGHDQLSGGGAFAWMDHGPLVALVYSIGDLNCHQKSERAFMVNGNQTAVCARDIGILFGFVVGALAWSRWGLNRYSIRDTFLSMLPDSRTAPLYRADRRLIAMFSILLIGVLPTGIDGFTQLLTSYESNNALRLITGSTAGGALAWLVGATISARASDFDSLGEVKLPAGASLRIRE
ncbi:MAG: DUF2085 domain-containing protein [Euryarchaeota archaeon]